MIRAYGPVFLRSLPGIPTTRIVACGPASLGKAPLGHGPHSRGERKVGMNNTDCILKSETRRAESHATRPSGSGTVPRCFWEWGIILIVAAVYLTHLAPGHNFRDDDFGAYVMHAGNLAEGRPYTAIHYIANPKTLWLAPPEGYPPVYPLLLAPVYRVLGL